MNPSSSAPLAERIGPLLHQIPHAPECRAIVNYARDGSVTDVVRCTCDRESRLAQAVARAIEAAAYLEPNSPSVEWRVENGLAALRALAEGTEK